jgi:hypothetical protein
MSRQMAWAAMASGAWLIGGASTQPPDHPSPRVDPNPAQTTTSCESAAAKWFKEHFPKPDEQTKFGWGKATYSSHFSAAKGGCFMEVIATAHILKNDVTNAGDTEMHHLVDLKTGQEIGQLVIVSNTPAPFVICELGKVKCLGASGWNLLIGPYMRDQVP